MDNFATTGLVERAKAITLKPDQTWPIIAAEPSSPGEILTRYAIPLAAIGPVATFVGGQLFGLGTALATYRPSVMSGLGIAVTSFLVGLISLVVVALITDFLAPKLDGQSNRTQAFKLVAYSLTPGWVAGVLGLVPSLGMLGVIASIYGLVLFYKGATPLMKVPQDKAVGFTVVTVVSALVVNLITAALMASVAGLFGFGLSRLTGTDSTETSAGVTVPVVGKIDTDRLDEATKSLEKMANGEQVKPIDIAALQALLPQSLGAYQRTSVESAGVGGIGSKAEATYRDGTRQVRVEIVDLAALGALASAVGGMGIDQNREDADGYERTRTVGGVIQTEKWDSKRSKGSFATQVSGRFMVSASGEVGSIDELKAIVGGIDQAKLADLAK